MKSLTHSWYQSGFPGNFLVWLLLPLSWLYCVIAVTRRKVYQRKFKKSHAARAPVVVIGNIVVGGSGKTPLLIALCEFIKDRGGRPGVVSRGYGGQVSGLKQVQENDSAELVGDEPLMIYRRAQVPVVVGADRVAAVKYLLENNQCDVVLSDDGLQHYRMQRDVEIAVVDSSRRFGNGFCLPAGPLREPVSRLKEVDIIVYNGAAPNTGDCSYTLKIIDLFHLNSGERRPLSSFVGSTVHAVAGIGHPPRFFTQLRDQGVSLVEHAFADHHVYRQADFFGWQHDCIIMTEKDASKCFPFAKENWYYLQVEMVFDDDLQVRLLNLAKKLVKNHDNV
jgi:tetraacyldisaccharide 4'-kinase